MARTVGTALLHIDEAGDTTVLYRLSPAEADTTHAKSCSCGDRAGHEAEDGSDYSITELPDEEDEQ